MTERRFTRVQNGQLVEVVADRDLMPCGTIAAYRRHLRDGDEPDPACKRANADAAAASRDNDYRKSRDRARRAALNELARRHPEEYAALFIAALRTSTRPGGPPAR